MKYNQLNYFSVLVCLLLVTIGNTQADIPVVDDPVGPVILLGSEADYPPYCSLDEAGQPTGFSVELFAAVADAANLELEIKIGPWLALKEYLAKGIVDALPIVAKTPEREIRYDFTIPYLQLQTAIFVRKGTNDIHTLDDLKEKEILVMKGDINEELAMQLELSNFVSTTTTFDEAFLKLAAGEADAVIAHRIIGLQIIDRLGLKGIAMLDGKLIQTRHEFCFAVTKGNDALLASLNEGLAIVMADGTYSEIYKKWFGPVIKEELSRADILRIALWLFLPLGAILSFFWIIALRREVKRRTRHLNEEIEEHKQTWEELQTQQVQLKRREAQIHLLLNSTAEGIYGIDREGNCTFINKSALEVLGFEDRSQVIGKNMHQLIHHTKPDGSPYGAGECEIHRAFRTGEGMHNDDDVLWRADGTSFPAEYYSYPIRENDETTGVVVTFWNITEQKKAKEELLRLKRNLEIEVAQRTAELEEKVRKLDKSQQAMLYMVEDLNEVTAKMKEERRKLELSNQELDAFTYSVSHDLRAPLRAINGYSDFLLKDYGDKLDEEGKRFLDVIRNNATKMDRLITDMLNLSRISRAEMRMTTVDLGRVAETIFREVATEEEQSHFEFEMEPLPAAFCDYALIKQVWINLISNALKYSGKSAVKKIQIGSRAEENELVFFVKDFGAGFNPKYKDKLFGVFQRLHRDDEFKGTGVGLAIVQRIIHRHGGRVWAEAELDQGATFYFSLLKN
ncbi:transporter substrate-binding domain-containing protein [Sunxiuqinia dokdonensis]|uniref:histidine kinase n=1 Tax=Sunxiuqinia dokdonensis TaxID=1409788 RepID=A0A0L8VF91_9BACT|nr:transporter substrate-binding domain-containing protein [Sunxiuqinia dokdonensis]KOH46842.1 histidine kinase [Sunxiuqinia dokdonensis]